MLVLCLIAGGFTPAYAAEPPPEMPEQFYGTVTVNGDPVAAGTLVEAFVAGVKKGETTVDGQGRYGYDTIFRVSGTDGATVTFYVGGALANETVTWQSGKVEQLNLTIYQPPGPPVSRYVLTMVKDPVAGGSATDETGGSPYTAGTTVSIRAVANSGYGFINWTANPTVAFADPSAPQTTFTMPAQAVTVTANFGVTYELDMWADPIADGDAIDVDAKGAYAAGATVRIRAEPAAGYGFVNWTADGPVTFQDATAAETTLTMPSLAVTIIAHFGVAYNFAMAEDPVVGGDAIDVVGRGAYAAGATVRIRAVANPGYAFGNWTASPSVTFANATAAETTFIMPPQAVAVTAHFGGAPPPSDVPTVTTQPATAISSYSGTVNLNYTTGSLSSVEVRFACKRLADPAWFYSNWVPKTADGTHAEVLTGVISQTQYEFKGQLKYDGTVIEGATRQFTTATSSGTNLNDLLGYFGCFIATAAYGTPTAKQIDVLREFRDGALLKSRMGSRFVALYYRLGPPVAEFIAGNGVLRTLVRDLLVDPIVWLVEATGDTWRT